MSKTNIWGQMSNLFNSVINTVTAALLFLFNRIVNTVKNPVLSNSDVDKSDVDKSDVDNSDVDNSNSISTISEHHEVINSVKKVSTSRSNVGEEEVYIDSDDPPLTYPMQAYDIRVGGYIVIKDRPCKVKELSTTKDGKHGVAKCRFTGIDIFTGDQLVYFIPIIHNVDVPNITQKEYTLINIDKVLSLMDNDGNIRDDIKLFENPDLAGKIKEAFKSGKEISVDVRSVMKVEQIISFKEINYT